MRPTVSFGLNLGGGASEFLIKAFAFLITNTIEGAQGIARKRPSDRGLAARFARAQWDDWTPSEIGGRRECRALDAPAASHAKQNEHTSVVTTVTPVSPGIPRATVLTAYCALSPAIGLSCHRHSQEACFPRT